MADSRTFSSEIKQAFFARLHQAHFEAEKLASADSSAGMPTVANGSNVEQLATLITSSLKCPNERCTTTATFPSILDHFKVCGTTALTEDSLSTSVWRVLAIKHILATVNGVEENKVSEAGTSTGELYGLGNAFACEECALSVNALGAASWSGAYVNSTAMNWAVAVRPLSSLFLIYSPSALLTMSSCRSSTSSTSTRPRSEPSSSHPSSTLLPPLSKSASITPVVSSSRTSRLEQVRPLQYSAHSRQRLTVRLSWRADRPKNRLISFFLASSPLPCFLSSVVAVRPFVLPA
jgi:hypothetical protein